jgi:hypothetical protein
MSLSHISQLPGNDEKSLESKDEGYFLANNRCAALASLSEQVVASASAGGVRGFNTRSASEDTLGSCQETVGRMTYVSPPTACASETLRHSYETLLVSDHPGSGRDNREDVFINENAKQSFPDIESALGKSYIDVRNDHMSSNSLDVLALYIKGQKLLYTEAKTYCEQQLNFLMLPAIFISCVGSIFSFVSERYNYGPIIIASFNGFNAFLLSLISYLKLDAKAQAHKTSAYKFDKLESLCEFNSGKVMFFNATQEDILSIVEKIESDVKEIKETNQFILPESIRYEFHFTYSTNVFMMVKRMHLTEISEINNLQICINKLTSLKSQIDLAKIEGRQDIIQKLGELIHLEEKKKSVSIDTIFKCRKDYYKMDEKFNDEIKKHMRRVNKWFITRVICCDWLKS